MSAARLRSRLASPSRAAGVFTMHDCPQDRPQDRPQESVRPAFGLLGADAGAGGTWRWWLGLRSVGAGLVPPGAGSRGGQVGVGALRWWPSLRFLFAGLLRRLRARARLTQEEL